MTIRLTWNDNSAGETGHKVYRDSATMDVNALPAPLAVIAPELELYDDTTAVNGNTYFYIVSSFKAGIEKFSQEIEVLAGVLIPNTLDPANKSVNIALSNNDLTATSVTAFYSSVTSTSKKSNSSTIVFEYTWDSKEVGTHSNIIGIVTEAKYNDPGNLDGLFFDTAGNGAYVFLISDGHVSLNGVRTNSVFTIVGVTLTMQLKMTSTTLELSQNNIPIYSINIPAGTYYVLTNQFKTVSTVNFGGTPLTTTLLNGETSWDGSQTG